MTLGVGCVAIVLLAGPPPARAQSIAMKTGPVQEHLFLKGKKLYDSGHLKKAIRVWSYILPDRLFGPVAYILTARSHARLRQPEKAEDLLREFLKKHPRSPYRNLAREDLLDALCRQKKPEARNLLRSAIRRARADEKPALILREADLEQGLGKYSEAADLYGRLYVQYPASVPGLKAAERLTGMVSRGKIGPLAYSESEKLSRATRLFRKGRFDLAADLYKSFVQKNPSNTRHRLKLAECLFKGRRNREAINQIKELLKQETGSKTRMEAIYLLSRLYWRLDRNKEFQATCKSIIEKGPPSLRRKALFNLGAYHLERKAFQTSEKYFTEVLKSSPNRSTKVDAKWKTAWTRYFRKQYKKASRAFREAGALSPGRIANASAYWEARCRLHLGQPRVAETLLKKIVAQAPLNYYGRQAARILRSRGVSVERNSTSSRSFPDTTLTPRHRSHALVRTAEKLMDSGLHEFAFLNLAALPASVRRSAPLAFLTARAAHGSGQYRAAQHILSRSFGSFMVNPPRDAPAEFVEMAFPCVGEHETVKAARRHSVDPYLVWAVIRQESRYDPSAVSPAGAVGLMQVTPRAAGLAGPGGTASPRAIATLLDPKKNVAHGTRILGANLRRFQGRIVPAIASYNADIRKVRHWYRRRSKMKQDEFIETIPYLETRLYVKKVLAGYLAYSQLHRRKNIAGLW